jgi:conjugal transfer pilus assembly protein TraU
MMTQAVNEPIWLMNARWFGVLKRGVLSVILVILCGLPFSGVVAPDTAEAFCQTSTNVLASSLATTCWECMFPISMAGFTLFNAGEDYTVPAVGPGRAPYYGSVLCGCMCFNGVCIPGLPFGIWEPKNLIEVVHDPLCFPSLGVSLTGGFTHIGRGSESTQMDGTELNHTFWNVHYISYPLWFLIGIGLDIACLNPGGIADEIDVVFISEIDPSWNDDILNLMLFPEALLIANPIALSACAADSLASSLGFPIDALFWCAGSQGFLYPPDGNHSGAGTDLGPAALSGFHMLSKLARVGAEAYTAGNGALICDDFPTGLIVKSQYKYQLIYPIPNTGAIGPCCQPIGRTLMMWGLNKSIPAVGEDYVFLLWKLQRCCML